MPLLPILCGSVGSVIGLWIFRKIHARYWPKTGKWALVPEAGHCQHCRAARPRYRWPTTWEQFWFGGWNCAGCGQAVDKFGKPIEPTGPG